MTTASQTPQSSVTPTPTQSDFTLVSPSLVPLLSTSMSITGSLSQSPTTLVSISATQSESITRTTGSSQMFPPSQTQLPTPSQVLPSNVAASATRILSLTQTGSSTLSMTLSSTRFSNITPSRSRSNSHSRTPTRATSGSNSCSESSSLSQSQSASSSPSDTQSQRSISLANLTRSTNLSPTSSPVVCSPGDDGNATCVGLVADSSGFVHGSETLTGLTGGWTVPIVVGVCAATAAALLFIAIVVRKKNRKQKVGTQSPNFGCDVPPAPPPAHSPLPEGPAESSLAPVPSSWIFSPHTALSVDSEASVLLRPAATQHCDVSTSDVTADSIAVQSVATPAAALPDYTAADLLKVTMPVTLEASPPANAYSALALLAVMNRTDMDSAVPESPALKITRSSNMIPTSLRSIGLVLPPCAPCNVQAPPVDDVTPHIPPEPSRLPSVPAAVGLPVCTTKALNASSTTDVKFLDAPPPLEFATNVKCLDVPPLLESAAPAGVPMAAPPSSISVDAAPESSTPLAPSFSTLSVRRAAAPSTSVLSTSIADLSGSRRGVGIWRPSGVVMVDGTLPGWNSRVAKLRTALRSAKAAPPPSHKSLSVGGGLVAVAGSQSAAKMLRSLSLLDPPDASNTLSATDDLSDAEAFGPSLGSPVHAGPAPSPSAAQRTPFFQADKAAPFDAAHIPGLSRSNRYAVAAGRATLIANSSSNSLPAFSTR